MSNPIPQTPLSPTTPFHLTFLWAVNLLWTLILLAMNVVEFLRNGAWTYHGPGSLIYFATLAAYAGVKETHNWTIGEDAAEARGRRGVFFVGVWVAFSMIAFVFTNIAHDQVFPHELLTITLEVVGIFFGTQASKALRRGRASKALPDGMEGRVLGLAQRTGGAGTAWMAEQLGATRSEVQYAVRKLVKQGRLKKVAEGLNDPETKYQAG